MAASSGGFGIVRAVGDMMDKTDPLYISLCRACWCLTKTRDGKCGKCGAPKDDKES